MSLTSWAIDMGYMGRSSHFCTYYHPANSPPNRKNDPYNQYVTPDADIDRSKRQDAGAHKQASLKL
jgi:hypothetical protein